MKPPLRHLLLLLHLVLLSSFCSAFFLPPPPPTTTPHHHHQRHHHHCPSNQYAYSRTSPLLLSTSSPQSAVIIIGAGVGGLVTAGRLARATQGTDTTITVIEKNSREQVGGRLNEYKWEGHRWETGPSLLLLPEVYEETFQALSLSSSSSSASETQPPLFLNNITKVEPSYLVVFDDNDSLDLYTDRSKMQAAIERLESPSTTKSHNSTHTHTHNQNNDAFARYNLYLDRAQANLDLGWPAFIEEKFPPLKSIPGFLSNVLYAWPLQGHHAQLQATFDSKKLQAALSFQDLYVGLSPYEAPAVFSLLQAIELNQGVYYPKGGFAQVSRELLRLVEAAGGEGEDKETDTHTNKQRVKVLFDTPVKEIIISEEEEEASTSTTTHTPKKTKKKAKGVRLTNGQLLEADLVISNVDVPFTNKYLLPHPHTQPQDHDTKRFSSSVVSFLWACDKEFTALRHHSVFLAEGSENDTQINTRTQTDKAQKSWEGLFVDNEFDLSAFNFYVHAPKRTDASVCPEGHDAIMVLVPCPLLETNPQTHTQAKEEEREKELVAIVKEALLQRFERFHNMENFRRHIIHERIITPREWREKYSLSRGAVFGLKHDLLQLSILRPGARNEGGIEGLYHVGASNRPGNGVPLVMVGAKLVVEKVMKDLYA